MVILTQPWPQWHPLQLSVPTRALAVTADLLVDRECVRQISQSSFHFKLMQLLLQSSFAQFIRDTFVTLHLYLSKLRWDPSGLSWKALQRLGKICTDISKELYAPQPKLGRRGSFLSHHVTQCRGVWWSLAGLAEGTLQQAFLSLLFLWEWRTSTGISN